MLQEEKGSLLGQMYKAFQEVIFMTQRTSLHTFGDMWKYIFIWSFCSAAFVHMIAALIAFGTLRKHKFGRLFSVLILFMGILVRSKTLVLIECLSTFNAISYR